MRLSSAAVGGRRGIRPFLQVEWMHRGSPFSFSFHVMCAFLTIFFFFSAGLFLRSTPPPRSPPSVPPPPPFPLAAWLFHVHLSPYPPLSLLLSFLPTEQLDFSCETEEEMHYIVGGFRALVSQTLGEGAGSSAFGSQSWVRKSAR